MNKKIILTIGLIASLAIFAGCNTSTETNNDGVSKLLEAGTTASASPACEAIADQVANANNDAQLAALEAVYEMLECTPVDEIRAQACRETKLNFSELTVAAAEDEVILTATPVEVSYTNVDSVVLDNGSGMIIQHVFKPETSGYSNHTMNLFDKDGDGTVVDQIDVLPAAYAGANVDVRQAIMEYDESTNEVVFAAEVETWNPDKTSSTKNVLIIRHTINPNGGSTATVAEVYQEDISDKNLHDIAIQDDGDIVVISRDLEFDDAYFEEDANGDMVFVRTLAYPSDEITSAAFTKKDATFAYWREKDPITNNYSITVLNLTNNQELHINPLANIETVLVESYKDPVSFEDHVLVMHLNEGDSNTTNTSDYVVDNAGSFTQVGITQSVTHTDVEDISALQFAYIINAENYKVYALAFPYPIKFQDVISLTWNGSGFTLVNETNTPNYFEGDLALDVVDPDIVSFDAFYAAPIVAQNDSVVLTATGNFTKAVYSTDLSQPLCQQ